MKRAVKEYDYFMKALKKCANEWGSQTQTAIGAEISEGYISQIINKKKRASFDAQVAIAKAFGYEYVDFLKIGMPKESDEINEDPEIMRLLEKVKKILESGNGFILDSLKEMIACFEKITDRLKTQSIRKNDPPEKKAEIIKLRAV